MHLHPTLSSASVIQCMFIVKVPGEGSKTVLRWGLSYLSESIFLSCTFGFHYFQWELCRKTLSDHAVQTTTQNNKSDYFINSTRYPSEDCQIPSFYLPGHISKGPSKGQCNQLQIFVRMTDFHSLLLMQIKRINLQMSLQNI